MTLEQNISNKLEFYYESDATASFLVIRCGEKTIKHQSAMLENNRIENVISPETVKKEGVSCFYYNITSKIPLSLFLKRRKLSREEFLRLLLCIISSVNNSSGYMLSVSNFIFSEEYIYIDPETLDPALTYVPAPFGQNGCEALQRFITELLLQHIHAEGFEDGNIVSRILFAVKSEAFNLKNFMACVTELLYGREHIYGSEHIYGREHIHRHEYGREQGLEQEREHGTEQARKQGAQASIAKGSPGSVGGARASRTEAENETDTNMKKEEKVVAGKLPKHVSIPLILLQFAMGGAIYLCRGFLNSIGKSPAATYAAAAMIVAAVDVIVLKKISDMRLINLREERQADRKVGMTEGRQADRKVGMTEERQADSKVGVTEAPSPKRFSGRTELLGRVAKGGRILKSTGKHEGDESIIIDKDDFIIGRLSGHVDHVINNNAVGKLHAELIKKDGRCYIKDLNSLNGTFINSKRIDSNKEYELKENDILRLANSEFIWEVNYEA